MLAGAALLLIAGRAFVAPHRWAHLTGIATEEDFLLVAATPDVVLSSVLICGIVLASLGLLIDVTVTQATAVWRLAETERSVRRLFATAMRTGREHATASLATLASSCWGRRCRAAVPVVFDRRCSTCCRRAVR